MSIQTASRRSAAGALLALSLAVFGPPLASSQIAQAQEQVLYLSIVDNEGNPVTDLTEDEIVVQWDGQDCETVEFVPVDWPIRVTVFVDNSQHVLSELQCLREGLSAFLEPLPDDVEVGLATTTRRPRWVLEHTLDRDALKRRINLIAPDYGAVRFRDALIEAAGHLNDDDARKYYPVIVMLSSDGAEASTAQAGRLDEMERRMVLNSAEVHTLVWGRGLGTRNWGTQAVFGEILAENTGGSSDYFTEPTDLVDKLSKLGRDLANKHLLVSNQYRVSYQPPQNSSDQPSLGVVTSREGLEIFPTFDGNIPTGRPQQ